VETFDRTGTLPELQFELAKGERVGDVVRWAGGLVTEANAESLSLQRRGADGRLTTLDIRLGDRPESIPELRKGDILSAYPLKEQQGSVVSVQGWVRAPGNFSRTEGLTVGKLLARDQQTLPDTYLEKGEIQRMLPDGSRQYLTFNVREALAGQAAHDLLLADRDVVELYKIEDLRIAESVTVTGPVARPGVFPFLQGMRAADLVFRAGLTVKSANTQEAELARFVDGKVSQVIRLDLQKLVSTDRFSPVDLKDDRVNPPLRPDDQLNIFQKPGFRVHRSVMVFGQVVRPGTYTLDQPKVTLSMILNRAGGVTPDAMVQAGILVRRNVSPKAIGNSAIGVSSDDPSGLGVSDILERLNETKRDSREGRLLRTPVLHGIAAGKMNRLVVHFAEALKGDPKFDVELEDGDAVIIPRNTDAAYVVGETASPFGRYKVNPGMKVKDLLKLAGGTTRNADSSNLRLLKADGRILDSWISGREVEPGDTLLVPQRIRRDTTWQENLNALTPIALILNAIK
jgi:protein involved in polysaccharide export with SLBB domain